MYTTQHKAKIQKRDTFWVSLSVHNLKLFIISDSISCFPHSKPVNLRETNRNDHLSLFTAYRSCVRITGLNLDRYNCNCGIVTRTRLICHLNRFLGSITPSSHWEFNFLCPSQALPGVHRAKLRSFLLLFTNFLSGRLIYRQEWRKKHFINTSLRKCDGLPF